MVRSLSTFSEALAELSDEVQHGICKAACGNARKAANRLSGRYGVQLESSDCYVSAALEILSQPRQDGTDRRFEFNGPEHIVKIIAKWAVYAMREDIRQRLKEFKTTKSLAVQGVEAEADRASFAASEPCTSANAEKASAIIAHIHRRLLAAASERARLAVRIVELALGPDGPGFVQTTSSRSRGRERYMFKNKEIGKSLGASQAAVAKAIQLLRAETQILEDVGFKSLLHAFLTMEAVAPDGRDELELIPRAATAGRAGPGARK